MDEQNLIFAGRSLESTERRGSSNRSIYLLRFESCGKTCYDMMSYFSLLCVFVSFGDSIDQDEF